MSNCCLEQLSGVRLPGPGALLGYACVAILGRHPHRQLGTGLQEKWVVKLFRESAGKIERFLPGASR